MEFDDNDGGGSRPVTILQLLRASGGFRSSMCAYMLVTRVYKPGEADSCPWTHAQLIDMVTAARYEGALTRAVLYPQIRNNADHSEGWRREGVVAGAVLEVVGSEAVAYAIRRPPQQNVVKMGSGVKVVDPAAIVCKVYTRLTAVAVAPYDTYVAVVGGILAAYELDHDKGEHRFVLTNPSLALQSVLITARLDESTADRIAAAEWGELVDEAAVMCGLVVEADGVHGLKGGFSMRRAVAGFQDLAVWWGQGGDRVEEAKAAAHRTLHSVPLRRTPTQTDILW